MSVLIQKEVKLSLDILSLLNLSTVTTGTLGMGSEILPRAIAIYYDCAVCFLIVYLMLNA